MVVPSYQTGTDQHIPNGRNPYTRGPVGIDPDRIPPALRALDQWANWHEDKVIRNSRTGGNGSSTNSQTWTGFAHAHRADPGRLVFVFAPDGGLVGLDVDHCRNAETGDLDARVTHLIRLFPNLYWEVSLSGSGLHGIGYGELPIETSGNHPEGIGVFHHSRYFVMTGNPLPGYETMGAYGDGLAPWYLEHFASPTKTTPAAPVALTMENHDIVERLRREKDGQGKATPLLAGDHSGYPDYSSARFALANKACFYTDDADQVTRILLTSGLFKTADRDRERERKAHQDATKALAEYTGPRYEPTYTSAPRLITPTVAADDSALNGKTPDELRAMVRELTARLDAERTARIAAEERVKQCTTERSHLFGILRNSDLGAARLTGFAIALDFSARLANGEAPTDRGLKAPAKRYAEMTGLSENVVAGHMRILSNDPKKGMGLITKHVVREQTERETEGDVIDSETGEIQAKRETVRGLRDANYIEVPEGKVINLIDRLATYQRPDDAGKHGGKRPRPKCEHHPDAGTVVIRSERVECACCRAILEESEPKRTYHPPETDDALEGESSDTKMMPVTSVVNPLLSDTKMMPEPEPESAPIFTGSIMTPEPSTFTVPADFWDDVPPEPGAANVCACGAPLSSGTKWTCGPNCPAGRLEVSA